MDRLLKLPEVAALCDWSPHTVRKQIETGRFPIRVHSGPPYRFRLADVRAWVEDSLRTAAPPTPGQETARKTRNSFLQKRKYRNQMARLGRTA